MIYVDRLWRQNGRVWAHIFADTTAELHDFVTKTLNIKRERFRGHLSPHFPHYVLNESQYQRAINLGVRVATRKEIITVHARFGCPAAMRCLRRQYKIAVPRHGANGVGYHIPEAFSLAVKQPEPKKEPPPIQPRLKLKFSKKVKGSSGRLKVLKGKR